MKKNILNLEGVTVLTKQQKKQIYGRSGVVCTLVCDGVSSTVQDCSNPSGLCNGDLGSCDCTQSDAPAPLDPPREFTRA